jgi:hypothetical protein
MIIEIKDLPNNQLISKVDLHIDFQNGSVNVNTVPTSVASVTTNATNTYTDNTKTDRDHKEAPEEMNMDF